MMNGVNGKLRVSNWKCIAVSLVLAAVFALLAWPALVQSEAFTPDQKEARAVENAKRPVRRAAPEQAIGGITIEERLAQQARLNARLVEEIPEGAMETPVRIELSNRDRDDLAAPAVSGVPLRIGVVKAIPSDVGAVRGNFKGGTFEKTPDGGFVWAATVSSPGAQGIRVHFEGFSLPPDAEVYFYSLNGQAHGPYTGKGRNGNGEFWTRSIRADTGVIQLCVKEGVDQQQISFMVSDLGHIQGRSVTAVDTESDLGSDSDDPWPCADNVDCLIDAMCTSGTPADPAKDAVAKMEWIQMPYIYTCTGGLLADTDSSTQIPYFLTANHCFDVSISNLETFFWYTTDECNGTCPGSLVHGGTPPPPSTIGITVVATGTAGDYTLATLDEDPPAGVTFLGWNNDPVAFTDGTQLYRISNANFGPQVYADYEVDTGSPTCGGIPRGQWIYSENIQGSTMGGSSGSPVLNSASEVVGQLTGCCGYNCGDNCDFLLNWTIDGALASYWDSVKDYLDPPVPECTTDLDCDDNVDCTVDSCNETTGLCDNVPNNAFCDNGLFCDGAETCDAVNGCQSGTAVECDDGVGCTDDSCNEATDSCDNVANDVNCQDDGLFCNGTEFCDAVEDCSSTGDPCGPAEICNEATDTCDPNPCDNDNTCEAGEDCNNCSNDCISGGGGGCGNGVCEPGLGEDCLSCGSDCRGKQNGALRTQYCCGDGDGENPVGCDDGRCNTDPWVCSDAPSDPYCCGDGACEGGEDVINCAIDCGCSDPADCDDGVSCTDDDCVGGACVNTPNDAYCPDDGEFCNGTEYCDAVAGCSSTGDPCQADETCNEATDQCEKIICKTKGEPCSGDAECCSLDCHPVKNTCK